MSGKNQKNRGTILMRMFYPDRREKKCLYDRLRGSVPERIPGA
mgnify:CR=1 FL=1